jgi:acyl carrier protein
MKALLSKMAVILEEDQIEEIDDLKSFPLWDSLSVLSVIAMLDADYGVNLHATDFERIGTIADLWNLVQARKATLSPSA